MPQAIGVGFHMLKNRVASQVWQERADKLTRQGVSQRCRAIKIFRMSVIRAEFDTISHVYGACYGA